MESQRCVWREMRKLKKPFARGMCTTCAGWEDFGGVRAEDVSMGPICVCDKTSGAILKYKYKRYA